MTVTRIIANPSAPDPMALAKFYAKIFELDLPFDMAWIAFLNKETTQKIELHTASEGGSGTKFPVISIGVEDLDAIEVAVRAAGAEVVYGPVRETWGFAVSFSVIQPVISSMLSIAEGSVSARWAPRLDAVMGRRLKSSQVGGCPSE